MEYKTKQSIINFLESVGILYCVIAPIWIVNRMKNLLWLLLYVISLPIAYILFKSGSEIFIQLKGCQTENEQSI